MKKTLLFTIALLISVVINAQTVLINETFDSMEMPEGWTVMGNASDNWSISNTNIAGGEANEAKLFWYPQFQGVTRLVAAPVDLTDVKSVKVNLKHHFENPYSSNSSMIGIATSSDNGSTWHSGWSCEYKTTDKYSIEERIETVDMGKENVLICIYFEGQSQGFQAWHFDDFIVTAQTDTEIRLNSIDIYERIGAGSLNIRFSAQNMGNDNIKSLSATYQIEGQDAVTETFSTSMAAFETKQFTFITKKNILPGEYNININITEVNGTQDNTNDNSLSKTFNVSISEKQRIPMIEHFSSSTCAPCVLINQLMNKLTENNPGKYTYTKYVVNYPGVGDPYYTTESGIRKDYYEAYSVPRVHLDSELQLNNQTAQPVTQTALTNRYEIPAFVDIRGAFSMDENNVIHVTADVISYVNLNKVRTFISVNEKTTTENHVEYGGNGETEWHHVMMKMLDGGNGLETTLSAGESQRFEFTYDMSQTFMEEADDLEVAVWIQDYDTKEIFNSHYLYEYTEHPYPVENLQLTSGDRLKITWDIPENANPIGYNLYIDNKLILNNTQETSFNIDMTDFCIVEVVALYENNMTSVGTINIFSSEFETPQNVNVTANTSDILVSWDAIDNAISYEVFRNGKFLANATETNYTDTNIKKDEEYCYQIKAVYDNNKSILSKKSCIIAKGDNIEEFKSSFNIYPNPVDDKLYIETDENVYEVNIYSINGQRVNNATSQRVIDVAGLKSGIYFIKIETDNGNIIRRFVKI